MSRSYRKNAITGNVVASSEKYDKRVANKSYRKYIKHLTNNLIEDVVKHKIHTDRWNFSKDGKFRFEFIKDYNLPMYNKLLRK